MFLFAAAAMATITGASLLFPNAPMDRLWQFNKPAAAAFRSLGWISGAGLLVLGAASLAGGAGLLQGKRWAWVFAVVLFAVNGCGDVVSLLVTGDWLRSASGVAISAGFLYLLSRSRVRRYFRQGR